MNTDEVLLYFENLTKEEPDKVIKDGNCMNGTNRLLYQMLYNSPLFHLSLADKELFHSNFLAWLGEDDDTKPLFVEFIKAISGIDLQRKLFTVQRESKNYDLSILDDKGNLIFVLENKNKSIPSKGQLDRYKEKVKNNSNVKFVLLSLATKFPEKDKIVKSWNLISYARLACILRNHTNLVNNCYKKQLIEDYIHFILCLHFLSQRWLLEKNFFMPESEWKELNKCRIHDLCDKIRTVYLMSVYNKNHSSKINWFYSNGSAALEWSKTINGDCGICIQIQGGYYRHAIVGPKEDANKTKTIDEISEKGLSLLNQFPIDVKQLFKLPENDNGFFDNNNSIFERLCYPIDKSKENKLFNKFEGNNKGNHYLMIYQQKKIKKEITCQELFEFLEKDIQDIEAMLSKI